MPVGVGLQEGIDSQADLKIYAFECSLKFPAPNLREDIRKHFDESLVAIYRDVKKPVMSHLAPELARELFLTQSRRSRDSKLTQNCEIFGSLSYCREPWKLGVKLEFIMTPKT